MLDESLVFLKPEQVCLQLQIHVHNYSDCTDDEWLSNTKSDVSLISLWKQSV